MGVWNGRKWWLDNVPACFLKKIDLFARSIGVRKNQSFADNIECRINVHWVGILEAHEMKL